MVFFKRILNQAKTPFIFYQLEYLQIFHTFLNEGSSNNKLLEGFKHSVNINPVNKKVEAYSTDLKAILY
jgi:hypothetical protein